MDKLELIDIISRTGMEYREDDFTTAADIIWLYFIDTNMFTEDELALVIDLNGYSEETLNDMLFSRYGYRDLPQYLESEVLYESTKISKRQVVSVLKSAGLQPSDYYIDSDNYIVLYTYKQYEVVEMLEKVFGERAVEFTRDDGVVAIKGFVKGAIHESKTLTEATANYVMSSKGFKTYVYREDPSDYHIPHEVKGRLYDEAYEIALQLVDEGDEDFNTYLFDTLRDLEQEYLSEEEYINFKDYYNNIKRVLDDFLYFYIGNVMDKLESSEHFDKILKERDISVYEVGNFIKEEYDIEIKGGYYSGFSIVIKKHDYMGPEYMGEDLVDEISRLVKEEIETNLYPELEAEGLIPIKVQARFSTGETMYELDESLKSARYTKKLTEAKERVKRYSYYEIDEEVYEVDMWEIWYHDRNTQHIRITNHTGDVYKDKTTYYNRTWERFEYQTVLLKLLNKMYKDEKLVDRIAKQVETNMRHVINETSQQGNNKKELDWLLSLPDGFLVAISACRGKDCSRTDELEKRLQRKNYIRVTGKWDKIEEISFLVFTESKSIARALIETGIYEFNQEDVYVWKTPMTMADITEGTNEGTRLDGKYYYFDLDKIIMNRDTVKEK